MKVTFLFLLSIVTFCPLRGLQAEGNTHVVSLCSIQEKPEHFLGSQVDLRAMIFVGFEAGRIREGKCSFRFAFGDDYQTFGDRFHARLDAQWVLMRQLLGKAACPSKVRVVHARIMGTVIRVPATGTIPENEMPPEIVIQSVSEVEQVPVNCASQSGSGTPGTGNPE